MAIINNFIDIVTKKYFCFEGRAGRAEFWQFFLVNFIVGIILSVIQQMAPKVGGILFLIYWLALLCPTLGCTARRFHDIGKSGWMQLLGLIPFVGGLIVLIMCIPEGDKEANAYGEPVA